jgi:uncharacterized protein
MTELHRLEGGHGVAVPLDAGSAIEVVNTFGSQVVDTWALGRSDPSEYLSMAQTRRMLWKLVPALGDELWSNRRAPMLSVEEDTSPGVHDTLFDSCDEWVYASYGCPPGHRSCKANFREALAAAGLERDGVPAPFNLFMNVPVRAELALSLEPPVSRPGDLVRLRALMDVTVVLSACPMDVTPVNGPDLAVRDVHWRVVGPS